MSIKAIAGILIGAVVVVGGGYYLLSMQAEPTQSDVEASQETGQQNQEEQSAQSGAYTGSLADLAARGGSFTCSVDSSTQQSISSGTTYVSGNMVRADFTTDVEGYGAVESHLLVRDGYSYSWSPVMPQGVKAHVAAAGQGGTATSGSGGDANQSYSYHCEPWAADASLFVVPTNITFRSI